MLQSKSNNEKTRIAFVIQRYGEGVIGGAESLTRQVAKHLLQYSGIAIDVYTSTAIDYVSWRHDLKIGLEHDGSIRVFRFKPKHQRHRFWFNLFSRVAVPFLKRRKQFWFLSPLLDPIEKIWYRLQGPYTPDLIDKLAEKQSEYDCIYFYTYLYYPTVEGMKRIRGKKILATLAHDEAPFYFLSTEKCLELADFLLVNSTGEERLIRTVYPQFSHKIQRGGVGIDFDVLANSLHEPKIDLPNKYVLYMGRLSRGKGVDKLVEDFRSFVAQYGSDTKLVLAGHLEDDLVLPDEPWCHYVGFVDESTKGYLIKKARCMINPSPFESLSLIVVEALALETPCLVNANCEVFKQYRNETDAIELFESSSDFRIKLARLLEGEMSEKRRQTLMDGKAWAERVFDWRNVAESYAKVGGFTL